FLGVLYMVDFYKRNLSLRKKEKDLNEELLTYETVFKNLPDLIFTFDEQGFYREVISKRSEDILLPMDTIVGKNIKDIFQKDIAEEALNLIRDTLKTKKNNRMEYSLNIEGEERYFVATLIYLSKNKVLSTVRNVTDYVSVNKSLSESEEKYRFLFHETSDGIMRFEIKFGVSIDLTPERQIELFYENAFLAECNEAYAKMYGFENSSELIGRKAKEFLPLDIPENNEMVHRLIESGYRMSDVTTYEKDRYGKNKVFSNSIIGKIKDQKIYDIWSIQRDITEKMISQEKSRQEKELMDKILSSLEIGIIIYDKSMNVLWINEYIKKIFPYGDPVGRICYEHFAKRSSTCDNCPVVKTFLTGLNQIQVNFDPKVNRWFDHRTFAVNDENTEGFQVLEVIFDVTQQVKDKETKEKMEREIIKSQKLESLGILAGGVAHDFNNLLMGIMGNADLLSAKLKNSPDVKSHILEILQASKSASELTKKLLSYSGKGILETQYADVNLLIEESNQIIGHSVPKNVTLKYDLEKGIPFIRGDIIKLRQMVGNLITNAFESLEGRNGLIIIRTKVYPKIVADGKNEILGEINESVSYISIEVSDSGSGMDRDTLSKIFDPFFSTKFVGRGLGLAAVLGIVKAHKGFIKVVSEPGKGSVFKVFLPVIKKENDEKTEKKIHSEKKTVLLIEDEKMVRNICEKMLSSIGYRVLTAEDGLKGIEVFSSDPDSIAVVILDLSMPKMDGKECLLRIREIKKDARVVISSGYSEEDMSKEFHEIEVNGFIQKPYNIKTLKNKLAELTQGRKN
ncbi:response regulator, partial [candidate division WOR-3 bacterium]|nr:response regulator [candidate division WOR-3 bacterium]